MNKVKGQQIWIRTCNTNNESLISILYKNILQIDKKMMKRKKEKILKSKTRMKSSKEKQAPQNMNTQFTEKQARTHEKMLKFFSSWGI